MDLVFLSLILGFAMALFVYLTKNYNHWEKCGIPSIKNPFPGLGHLLPVMTQRYNYSDMCKLFYETYKDCSMVGFYDQREPALIVREPELIKTVLQTNFGSFQKNVLHLDPETDPLLAPNPFFNSGDTWIAGRKRLTYAFSSMRLKALAEIVQEVSKKFENYLDRRLKNCNKYEAELKDLFTRYTGEVVANAGLGIEGHCFDDKHHPYSFIQISKDIFEPTIWKGFLQSLIFVLPILGKIFHVPFLAKRIDKYFRTMVRESLAARRSEKVPRSDFLQLMYEMESKEDQNVKEETLASHVVSFFVDGVETSSITLHFLGFHLATNMDVQRKLRDEVKSVLAKHGGVLSYDAIKEMTYMNQVLSESQRLEPAFGNLLKVCTSKFELVGSDGLKCELKPGTKIIISNQGIHRDPKYWPNPDKFDPDRFSDDKKEEITKYAFLPFGEGPRMCVGMRMAVLQVKYAIATLLNKYSIELSPKTRLPLKIDPAYFLRLPIGGMWVYIKPLKE